MNLNRKKPDHNRGTSKFSLLRLKKPSKSSADVASTPKISTFFNKVEDNINNPSNLNENEMVSTTDSESPYKNCLSEIISANIESDDNCFALSKPTLSRLSKSQPVNTKRSRTNTKQIQNNTLVKMTKKKMKEVADDVNLEHLQMAIALSKSVQEEDNSNAMDSVSTNQEKPSLRNVLAQFGFRSGSSKNVTKKSNNLDFKTKNKKSKFRYITPTLLLRTTEERESLISSKISLILSQNRKENSHKDSNKIYSDFLKNLHAKHSIFFETNDKFYVDQLNLSPHTRKCGYLLKDWSKIPGRDDSPQQITRKSSNSDDIVKKNPFESRIDCISPDLFESSIDSAPKTPPQSPNKPLSQSLINLSPNKSNSLIKSPICDDLQLSCSNKSGIQHYESFKNDNSLIVYDLTQSSDEDNETEKDLLLSSKKNLFNTPKSGPTDVSFPLDVDIDGIGELNVTEYVHNLLKCDKEPLKLDDDDDGNSSSVQNSQESIVISDEELNYSSIYATPAKEKERKCEKTTLEMSSNKATEENQLILETTSKPSTSTSLLNCLEDSFNVLLEKNSILDKIEAKETLHLNENAESVTPKTNVTIKSKDVTPMMDYDKMDTPKIVNELNRFGLKPMKRHRGAKLLKYIYETTHPVVNLDENSDNEDERQVKRSKTKENAIGNLHLVGDAILEGENLNDLIFERKQSMRVHSCRIPLQIVWYNFLQNNPEIYENILTYEPLQLEVLHAMLKEQGYKFNVQDLLSFLDKKCITIRTNQKTK